jgi:2-iminoacetate synthase ThiH
MQVRACQVYAQNDLFGTYQEESNSFQYTTFEEYNQNVDRCRAVLKDLGEW